MIDILLIFLPFAALIILMIALNALYVGAEFATVGSRKTRIRQLAAEGNRSAQMLLPVLESPKQLDDYVAACQLGITISSLALGAVGERSLAPQIEQFFPELNAVLVPTLVLAFLTLLQVILGELLPKSMAVDSPERVSLAVIYPIRISQFILRPFIWFFNGSGKLLLRLFGMEAHGEHGHLYSSEEIEILVSESNEGGLLDDDERMMLRNAFRLRDLTARHVMIHRTRLISESIDCGAEQLLDTALEAGYTRIPVYEDSIDNIVGFVHVKDVFKMHVGGVNDLHTAVRKVVYVPESLPIMDVWEKLNAQRQYVAIVFDEYGGTAGMITQEDLIEEIFGELQDEFDNEEALVKVNKDGRVHLRGDLLISDINEYLSLKLPEAGADSIGGLVLSVLTEQGARPSIGDSVTIGDVVLKVESMDDLGVTEVSLPASADMKIPQLSEWEVQRD